MTRVACACALVALVASGCEPVVLDPYVDPSKVRLTVVVEGPGFDAWEGEEVELYSEVFTAEGIVEDGELLVVEDDALPPDADTTLSFILFVDEDDDDDCEDEPALRFVAALERVGNVYRVRIDMADGVPTQDCATLPDD